MNFQKKLFFLVMELAHAKRVFFSIGDPTHKMSGFLKFPSKVHSLTFDASLKLSWL